jgi:hypothetical protein
MPMCFSEVMACVMGCNDIAVERPKEEETLQYIHSKPWLAATLKRKELTWELT